MTFKIREPLGTTIILHHYISKLQILQYLQRSAADVLMAVRKTRGCVPPVVLEEKMVLSLRILKDPVETAPFSWLAVNCMPLLWQGGEAAEWQPRWHRPLLLPGKAEG